MGFFARRSSSALIFYKNSNEDYQHNALKAYKKEQTHPDKVLKKLPADLHVLHRVQHRYARIESLLHLKRRLPQCLARRKRAQIFGHM